MNQLMYSPFGRLNQLHRDLNRVFDTRYSNAEGPSRDSGTWVPQVDVREEDERYRVVADVPGVNPADVDITLDRNVLTIRGSRTTEHEQDQGGFKRRERISGHFVRQFTLPETADADNITARVDNGVLEVTIPKCERVKRRSITIE